MFDNYIEQYGKRLFGLCITLCRNRSEAEDLYQDTWLKAYEKIDQYKVDSPFEPWLTAIAVNLFRDRLRRSRSSPIYDSYPTAEDKEKAMESISAVEKQDYSYVRDAVEQLPNKLRTTVILHYYSDFDVRQTAEILKIPGGTVKSRLNKARVLLKEALHDEVDF